MDYNDILNYFKQSDEQEKPKDLSLEQLYAKYNQGYSPEEADQAAKVLGDATISGPEAGPLKVQSAPEAQGLYDHPYNSGLLQHLRAQAGVSPEAEMQAPTRNPNEVAQDVTKSLAPQAVERGIAGIPSPKSSGINAAPLKFDATETQPKEDYLAQLRAAQEAGSGNQFGTGLIRAGTQIGGAIANTKPDYSGVESLEKNNQRPTQMFQEKLGTTQLQNKLHDEQEMNDPASPTSKMLRSFANKFGVSLPENVSGKHIKEVAPYIIQAYEAAENRKMRLELSKNAAEAKAEAAGEKKTAKSDTETTNRFDKMGKLITAEVTSGRSSFGQDAAGLRTIENAQALLHGNKDLNALDSRQVYEAARVLDRLLSGGTGSIKSSSKLTPETAKSWMNETLEKLTNQRRGAELGSFLKNMDETFSREKKVAEERVKRSQKKLLGNFKDLREKDQDKWNTIMTEHGLPSDPFAEPGIKVRSPKGDIKLIPKEQLDAALKAGGTLVE